MAQVNDVFKKMYMSYKKSDILYQSYSSVKTMCISEPEKWQEAACLIMETVTV